VLAGGARDAVAAADPSAPNKAFVAVAGVALVARVIAVLRAVPRIERIVAVAPADAQGHAALREADEVRPDGPRMLDSLRSGLRDFPADEPALIVASDLPVLDRATLDEFLDLAASSGAALVYSCVERGVHEARYAEFPHTWAHLHEGSFCGGGCAVVAPRLLPVLEGTLEKLGSARKNPLALAAIFGADVLAKYALGRLSIADAEARAGRLLGAPASAAVCQHAEIAINIDRPGDLELAERLLSGGASASA